MESVDTAENSALCKHCNTTLSQGDKFCGNCGKAIEPIELVHTHTDVFQVLSPMLLYYFITLILLSVYKFTDVFPQGVEGMLTISLIDIAVVLVFWMYHWHELKPLFSLKGFRLSIALLTVCGAFLGSVAIFFLADIIQVSISDDVFYDTYLFHDTSFPLLTAILFICVQPAIFEEVAFRGFLFTTLQKVSSPIGVVYITSFIFGIIHLAFISLLWLVPIGLAFAFLRLRYHTLWYGVIGHFTYNLGIILLEFITVNEITL